MEENRYQQLEAKALELCLGEVDALTKRILVEFPEEAARTAGVLDAAIARYIEDADRVASRFEERVQLSTEKSAMTLKDLQSAMINFVRLQVRELKEVGGTVETSAQYLAKTNGDFIELYKRFAAEAKEEKRQLTAAAVAEIQATKEQLLLEMTKRMNDALLAGIQGHKQILMDATKAAAMKATEDAVRDVNNRTRTLLSEAQEAFRKFKELVETASVNIGKIANKGKDDFWHSANLVFLSSAITILVLHFWK